MFESGGVIKIIPPKKSHHVPTFVSPTPPIAAYPEK
jgi:hypothetical protein